MIKDQNANRGTSVRTFSRAALLFVCMMCLSVFPALAQNIQIKGKVVETGTNEPIPGVNIVVEGTTNGVITDFDGNYQISAPSNATLIFSFIGFIPQKQAVQGRNAINVTLASDTKQLDEVVAIGYGTSKKKDLTGSVTSISSKDIANIPVANTASALTGRLAGVQITTADGSPDAEMIIRVRGGGSVTGDNSPLYIVDGFPVSSINDIAPSDIKSIDVLKDASSTAIYGSQGANGVVIITTNQAKGGKTTINYNGYFQTKKLSKRMNPLNSYEYALLNYELAALDGEDGIHSYEKTFGVYDDIDLYKSMAARDWQDDMFGSDVLSTQHNLSITGGSEKTKFALSTTYNKDGGLMENNQYERFSANFKLSHEISKKLRLNLNTRMSDTDIDGSGTSGGNYKIRTTDAITKAPVKGLSGLVEVNPASLTEDEYEEWVRSNMTLTEQAAQYWKNQNKRGFNFTGSLDWDIIKNLTYRLEGGYDYGFNETQNYWGEYTTNASYVDGLPLVDWKKENTHKMRAAQTLSYKFKVNEFHRFDAMVGQEFVKSSNDNNYVYATSFGRDLSPEKIFANMGLGGGTKNITSYISPDDKMMSFFGRLGYNLKDRYMLTYTMRLDGSSKFPVGNQWGVFPAAAVAWRISDEPFMSSTSGWLSNLKLRLSYGEVGNNRIKDALFKLDYAIATTKTYGLGDEQNNYYASTNTQLANPNLKWETTITRNIGLDYGFFDERISGSIEAYWNSADDLLINRNIVAPGYTTTVENVGATSNKGLEFVLNAFIIEKKDFSLSANFNIGYNLSNVDKLADGINMQEYASGWAGTDLKGYYDYHVEVGQPVGLVYGWQTDGYYTTDNFSGYDESTKKYILKDGVATNGFLGGKIGVRPGTIKFKDQQKEGEEGYGVIDENDRAVIGKTNPKFIGGFGFNATYHGFDASVLFNFVLGNDIYNANKIASTQQYRTTRPNMLDDMRYDNRYTYLNEATGEIVTDLSTLKEMNEGSNAKEYWSPFSFGNAVAVPHSWAIEDGSYLRLQNVTLGYTIPKTLTRKFLCEQFRVYCTLNNLWILTNYSGYDPEVSSPVRSSSTSALTPGVDYSSYPKSFAWTFGVNLTF